MVRALIHYIGDCFMEGYAGTCMKEVRELLVEIRDLLKSIDKHTKSELEEPFYPWVGY